MGSHIGTVWKAVKRNNRASYNQTDSKTDLCLAASLKAHSYFYLHLACSHPHSDPIRKYTGEQKQRLQYNLVLHSRNPYCNCNMTKNYSALARACVYSHANVLLYWKYKVVKTHFNKKLCFWCF